MNKKYQIDSLDAKILRTLQSDSRTPFLQIAREAKVSGGTIHQRVEKLIESGILKSFSIEIDTTNIGFEIQAFVGITLHQASDASSLFKKLHKIPEVLECHYTTGKYAAIVKVATSSIREFQFFLMDTLQKIDLIHSTETFLCLDSPIDRQAQIRSK